MIDVRWLLILFLAPIVAFVLWVFWSISKDIGARKRRRIRTYRIHER
jgi:hypothetical protein